MKLQSRPQRLKALPHRSFAPCLKARPDTNLNFCDMPEGMS
jgi:hypothetical protein